MADTRWTICLDGKRRIECDGELVAWVRDRKWEQVLLAIAAGGGAPVSREALADEVWPGALVGKKRLSEELYLLKEKLTELGAPEDAIASDRTGVWVGPGMSVQTAELVLVRSGAREKAPLTTVDSPPLSFEELVSGIPRRHMQRCAAIAEQAAPHLWGPDKEEWIQRIDAQKDSLEAGLEWALEEEQGEYALRIAGSLWPYWYERCSEDKGRGFLERAMQLADDRRGSADYARCLNGAGALAALKGDMVVAQRLLEDALAIFVRLSDRLGQGRVLGNLGIVAYKSSDHERARRFYDMSINVMRRERARGHLGSLLKSAAFNEMASGNNDRAEILLLEALDLARSTRDESAVATTLVSLSSLAQYRQDWDKARDLGERALIHVEESADLRALAFAARSLGFVLYKQAEYDAARTLLETSLTASRAIHSLFGVGDTLRYLAAVEEKTGNTELALDLAQQASSALENTGDCHSITQAAAALRDLEELVDRENERSMSGDHVG